MLRILISYSHENFEVSERLKNTLEQKDIIVWRDQESIYKCDAWPKAIGEYIAQSDLILLVWSIHAAQSYFVQFEWNTAIALKKTIIPILVDSFPLPPALSSVNGIPLKAIENIVSRIFKSVGKMDLKVDQQLQSDIIRKLACIQDREPQKVLLVAKSIFEKQQWMVKGNVYQVSGENININVESKTKSKKKMRWKKLYFVVAFCVAVLAILWYSIDLTQKINDLISKETSPLRGTVKNIDSYPVEGAILKLEELPNDSTITTSDGGFYFSDIPGKPGERVRLFISVKGYKPHNEYVTLPGPVIIQLEKAN